MTVDQLHDLLLATLVRTAGGNRRRWRIVVGPVRVYDPATHPHCNWSISPAGGFWENDIVEIVLDRLRLAHPQLVAD